MGFDVDTYNELNELADSEFEKIEASMPEDPISCFVILNETVRVLDYLNLASDDQIIKEFGLSVQELDVMNNGWNHAASLLFKSTDQFKGFPLMESTIQTRRYAIGLLYQLGSITLLRRTAEMLKSGILSSKKEDDKYTFSISNIGKTQFQDELELFYLKDFDEKVKTNRNGNFQDWKLVEKKDIHKMFLEVGNFMSVNKEDYFAKFKIEDIDAEMISLLRPWDSGKGIMMAYDSTPEIDRHFMVIAAELLKDWQDLAGFHPKAEINGIKGSDISAVVMCLVSFNLKHVHFASLAAESHSNISIPQSLTIWKPLEELVIDIADFMGMDNDVVEKVFMTISFSSDDVNLLKKHTTKFMPLIIDMGNGYVIRPVSSIMRNPLNTIKDLLILRRPSVVDKFYKYREDWLRSNLYAQFGGTRYQRVEKNIFLRKNKKTITDIDAAIYDNLTGELALFQIKWQDYHMNDVKKLRSRAKNLTHELDEWARKVSNWISSEGVTKLIQNLRISNREKSTPIKIYLFGLSKNAVHMQGYGFTLEEKNIAISTWAQFTRNRAEIGPTSRVFDSLFQKLKNEEEKSISPTPLPVQIKVSDKILDYKDLWCYVDD